MSDDATGTGTANFGIGIGSNVSNNTVNTTTIVAPTSREALRLVREQLGPDAVILSNRVTAQGVEIVAIIESALQASETLVPAVTTVEQAPVLAPSAPISPAALVLQPVKLPPVQIRTVAPALGMAVAVSGNDSAQGNVLTELHAMRGMIEEQLAGLVWSEKQRRDPVRGHLLRTLLGAGFSARLAKAMLDHLPTGQNYASGMAWVKAELRVIYQYWKMRMH